METPLHLRLANLTDRIETAACKAGRDSATIRLIAVSKTQPRENIEALITAGHTCFGENKVQEAALKFETIEDRKQLELHLIGPLQTNKAKQAVRLFDMIHTVDRIELVDALAKAMADTGHTPRFLIQVNTGREPQKAGVTPEALPELLAHCQRAHLYIEGLMCIPPVQADPVLHFIKLADLARQNGLKELSMGMSNDFEAAIMAGATYVRVGTAIFGERSD